MGEVSDTQIEHLRALLTRQVEQKGLRGQATVPPRSVLQPSALPGDRTVRMHLSADPVDRNEPCRLLRHREASWTFRPAELLDIMANPNRVFPVVCERCMGGSSSGDPVQRVLATHQLWLR